jgi:predicted DsbA family dithiol-disulfide isomerase
MADRTMSPTSVEPLEVELFMDYHCPYSHRVAAWLDGLGPERVAVRHRLFGLEQVNRDPTATEWRLWEQPLDYVHHQARQNRRSLAAFLATAIVEAAEPPTVARRFRAAVYAARFDERLDIADPQVLDRLASAAGAAPGRVPAGLSDHDTIEAARRQIAVDWAAGCTDYRIFGVPTLRVGRARPFYLRLARRVDPAEGGRFLDALLAFRAAAPDVLELKLPEPVKPA